MTTASDHFPMETEGLPEARSPEVIELADGDEFDLRIAPVAKRLGAATVRMLAYRPAPRSPTHLILARDGIVEPNLVWKHTVLIPTGQTVDVLLDVTNPGLWMAHCHIAEHHESGMVFSFKVEP
jgi:FtsP/CotA-like multicopper oxidase with cupredoxin domain